MQDLGGFSVSTTYSSKYFSTEHLQVLYVEEQQPGSSGELGTSAP